MEKHNKLIDILQKYGNEEFGDEIIDEISELFNYPKTQQLNNFDEQHISSLMYGVDNKQ